MKVVAAICHILVEDAPANLILIDNKAGNTPGCDVDKERLVYVGNMKVKVRCPLVQLESYYLRSIM